MLNFNRQMTLVPSLRLISDLGRRHSQALINQITISNQPAPGGLTSGGLGGQAWRAFKTPERRFGGWRQREPGIRIYKFDS